MLAVELRDFTAFAEAVEPEELMLVLREYHARAGEEIHRFEGTLERFSGSRLMVFFNDPVPCPDAPERAVRLAVAIRNRVWELAEGWSRQGYDLHPAVGIAQGHATLGRIGFEGRSDYAAIGSVTILAERLCEAAEPGQILDQPARARGHRGDRDRPGARRARPARVRAPRAGLRRRRPRGGAGLPSAAAAAAASAATAAAARRPRRRGRRRRRPHGCRRSSA